MRDIGIDLGTTNILVYIREKGIVLNEPSVLGINIKTKKVLAVGKEAYELLTRAPETIKVIKPIGNGIIDDMNMAEIMIKKFLKKSIGKSLLTRTRVLICCPSNIGIDEQKTIKKAIKKMGAKKVYIEERTKVEAVGAGIDISKPSGSMIIDIDDETTNIAVFSLGSVVMRETLQIAANDIEKEFNGSIKEIVLGVKKILEKIPYEIKNDISNKGMTLTGVGSVIEGISEALKKEIKIPIYISDNPLMDAIEGTMILLDNLYLIDD